MLLTKYGMLLFSTSGKRALSHGLTKPGKIHCKNGHILWLSLLSTHLLLCFFSSIYNDNINHDSDFQVSV